MTNRADADRTSDSPPIDAATPPRRRWRLWAAAAAFALLAVMAAARREHAPDWQPAPWALAPGRNAVSLEQDGRTRTALVFLPPDPPRAPRPLVVMLHGAGGSWRNVTETGWHVVGAREGVVVAYPNGTARDEERDERFYTNPQTWNSGAPKSLAAGTGSALAKGVDDVGFLDGLIDGIAAATPVDPGRVFVVGHSNGAGMALRYAWERPGRVAAAGAVAGHLSRRLAQPPAPEFPVPLFQVIGDADPFVPMAGGTAGIGRTTWQAPPAIESPRRWAAWHGVEPEGGRLVEERPTHDLMTWERDGMQVVRWLVIRGHGHGWPGSPSRLPERMVGPTRDAGFDATELLWEFFEGQPDRR